MVFDLHLHSTASDGQLTPTQVVQQAYDHHVEVMALSDHDTAAGVVEAQRAGKNLGIYVIPAIELSAAFGGELHILGYNIDIQHYRFSDFLKEQQRIRQERNRKMVTAIQVNGFPVTEDDCRALAPGAGENWGRSHMARAMVAKGLCGSVKEAFDRWLGYGKSCYISREKTQPQDCIKLIHDCGGLAVMAHPGLVEIPDHQRFVLIKSLKDMGLDGIEAFYPQHSLSSAAQFVRFAKQLDLYVSYGSDFHGPARAGNEMLAGWDIHKRERETAAFLQRLMEE